MLHSFISPWLLPERGFKTANTTWDVSEGLHGTCPRRRKPSNYCASKHGDPEAAVWVQRLSAQRSLHPNSVEKACPNGARAQRPAPVSFCLCPAALAAFPKGLDLALPMSRDVLPRWRSCGYVRYQEELGTSVFVNPSPSVRGSRGLPKGRFDTASPERSHHLL